MRTLANNLNKSILAAAGSLVVAAAPILVNFEGWRNTVYGDSLAKGAKELSTVCAGHTNRIGTYTITKNYYNNDECTVMLVRDIQYTDKQVRRVIGNDIVNQMPIPRRVALIDFTYNLGIGTLISSPIPTYIKNNEITKACTKMLAYEYGTIDGKKVKIRGLTNRRQAEYKMCMESN